MTQAISITRALTEVKHLADRITRAASEPFIGIAKGKDTHKTCVNSPSTSVVAVDALLKSNLQSVMGLIARREALKRAIITSNANTVVMISGVEMTVAEAIEKKANIGLITQVVQNLRTQFLNSRNKVDTENNKLYAEINTAVTTAYGNDKGNVDASQYEQVANPRLARSEFSLIDPNKVEETIKKLDSEVADFLSEVDFILSESNAKTTIVV